MKLFKRGFFFLARKGLLNWIPDKLYLKICFRLQLGYNLNLKNPISFNEKIQWLKLYDRKPEYTEMVDKYAVKELISKKLGAEYVIPTLAVYNSVDEIDFDALPNRFVLKCTHDSGGLVICQDKSKLDIDSAKKKLDHYLHRDFYHLWREWPYRNVPRRIIAEEYIEDEGKIVPEDYKVYCINGKPKYIVVFHNRFNTNEKLSESVYDTSWNKLDISLDDHFEVSSIVEEKPVCLDKMLEFSAILSENMAQSRIDFYIIDHKLIFGEITLYTASGFQPMIPKSLDFEIGKEIILPIK